MTQEELRAQADKYDLEGQMADSDFSAFTMHNNAKRLRRMADFLDELDNLQSQSCVLQKQDLQNSVFTFSVKDVGLVDFWPKKPCLRIRRPETYFRGESAFKKLKSFAL